MTCKKKSNIPIGEMDKIVAIREKTRTGDGAGGNTVTYTTTATVAASIEPISGSEVSRAEQQRYPISHVFKTRFRNDVTINGDHQLQYDGRDFNIRNVRDLYEDKRFLRILADENVAQ